VTSAMSQYVQPAEARRHSGLQYRSCPVGHGLTTSPPRARHQQPPSAPAAPAPGSRPWPRPARRTPPPRAASRPLPAAGSGQRTLLTDWTVWSAADQLGASRRQKTHPGDSAARRDQTRSRQLTSRRFRAVLEGSDKDSNTDRPDAKQGPFASRRHQTRTRSARRGDGPRERSSSAEQADVEPERLTTLQSRPAGQGDEGHDRSAAALAELGSGPVFAVPGCQLADGTDSR